MSKPNIYFDNAATTEPFFFADDTRLSEQEAPAPFSFGNPSSPHGIGIRTERILAAARAETAGFFPPGEIIYTSGGTESNNLAILGYALANRRKNIEIIAAPWEHPSVLEPIRFAEELGLAQATFRQEITRPPAPTHSVAPRLVCISHVSSETGDIADIAAIAARLKRENPETAVFVDGAQGFCKEPLDLAGVDMYSFSAHKIHGAAGVGGLFKAGGVRLVPLTRGGGQENGLRGGTENIAGILRTNAAAVRLIAEREENHTRVRAIKSELAELTTLLPDVHENALTANVSPYILNLSFIGIAGETLVHLLSEKGIYASMGAACRSRKKQKSVLETMGFSPERARAAVRFSFSHKNTLEEARAAKKIIAECVAQMRRVLRR